MDNIINYPHTGINTIMARLGTYLNMKDYDKAVEIIDNLPSDFPYFTDVPFPRMDNNHVN